MCIYLFPLLTLGAGFPCLPTYNSSFQHTKSLLIWQLVLITFCYLFQTNTKEVFSDMSDSENDAGRMVK